MVRLFSDGLADIRHQIATRRDIGAGNCKLRTREAFAVPSNGTPSAAESWKHAPDQHRDSNPLKAPANSFGWMTGGGKGHGHVVVNLGGGRILTPGGPAAPSRWYETMSTELLRAWPNLRWVGWTETIDGMKPLRAAVPFAPVLTRRAPGKRFYHDSKRTRGGSGTRGNSLAGSKRAKAGGFKWIDNDGHLSKDGVWVNAHGAPFRPGWLPKGIKLERLSWAGIKVHGVRSARRTFLDNAKLGLSTEWEIKDISPISDRDLNAAMRRLATSAKAAYGPGWQGRVQVKMLSNLSGGLPFARRVLNAAHAAGFTTILLARGKTRLRKISNPAITFVRGGRV